MEKNVPLLKLIQDPWSIKTMLSSRFMRVPLLPRTPSNNNTSSPHFRKTQINAKQHENKKNNYKTSVGGVKVERAGAKIDFFVHGCTVVVVSILTAAERCWCSEPAGSPLIPNTRSSKHRGGGASRSASTCDETPSDPPPCICSFYPTDFFQFQLLCIQN